MAQWKILRGVHADKAAQPVTLVEVPGMERQEGDGTFYPGDVIETEKDLSQFNTPSDIRFERLTDTEPEDELAKMTVAELEELAKVEEIEIPAKLKKGPLVEAVRGALKYRAAIS